MDKLTRTAKFDRDALNKEKNDISKIVAQRKKDSKGQDKCEAEIEQSKGLDAKIKEQDVYAKDILARQAKLLGSIGNIVNERACISNTEDDNIIARTFGTPNKDIIADGSALGKLRHHEVMQCLDMVEFERG